MDFAVNSSVQKGEMVVFLAAALRTVSWQLADPW